jgi:Xaa-Pro aminopeptidase
MSSTLTQAGLKADLDRRVRAAQDIMRSKDLKLIVVTCAGAPHHNGFIRYFTSAEIWGGREFLILRPDSLARHVVMRSTYDAEWIRQQAVDTTVDSTLIQQISPAKWTADMVAEITGGRGRIGFARMQSMTVFEYETWKKVLPGLELVDVTDDLNTIRQIKSPFEIEAVRETGRILTAGQEMFARIARPGRLAAEVAGEVDGYLKGQGCFWGRVKYSLDERPYTVPAAPDRRFKKDDVILFQFVHSGPQGYWYEMARVYSFDDLPKETARRLSAMEAAIGEAAKTAVPGGTYAQMSAAVDRVFKDAGLKVIGKHTYDCHPIGTDETEGRSPLPPDWTFKENMVLGVHPATLLEGEYGFLLCENFLVQNGGGVRMSPQAPFYQRLPSA